MVGDARARGGETSESGRTMACDIQGEDMWMGAGSMRDVQREGVHIGEGSEAGQGGKPANH